jgi:ABC-type polysaccharide/polyol phosphate export permease
MASPTTDFRTTSARVTFRSRIVDILGYRELLAGLVHKELKVRYKNSVLGFVWSLINPAITIAVYAVIFGVVFKNSIPEFALFLMTGVLIFNMFQTGLAASCGAIVGNAPLVKKVWFPREILPLASVGAALVDFLLQGIVLVIAITFAALTIKGWTVAWLYLPLIPLAIVTALLFTTALAVWLAAVNVQYRDMQHFLGIALMVWFWGTPIIYSINQVAKKLQPHGLGWLPYVNPFTPVVLAFQKALYGKPHATVTVNGKAVPLLPTGGYPFYLGLLGAVSLVSILLLIGSSRVFRRMEGDFAEEL